MSASILSALRAGPFREPAHAWLYEVRDVTGHSRGGNRRYADALVISVYPSRGIWFAGIEVKVSRSDWRAELDDPTKAAAIQRWCDFWWIAAPPEIVEPSEVPATWGHLVVDGRKVTRAKEAPRLTPDPLDQGFVASCLRNAAQAQAEARKLGEHDGRRQIEALHGPEARAELVDRVHAAESAKSDAEYQRKRVERDLATLRENVLRFERAAGLPDGEITRDGRWSGARGPGHVYKAAQQLREIGVRQIAERLELAAAALRELPTEEPVSES